MGGRLVSLSSVAVLVDDVGTQIENADLKNAPSGPGIQYLIMLACNMHGQFGAASSLRSIRLFL